MNTSPRHLRRLILFLGTTFVGLILAYEYGGISLFLILSILVISLWVLAISLDDSPSIPVEDSPTATPRTPLSWQEELSETLAALSHVSQASEQAALIQTLTTLYGEGLQSHWLSEAQSEALETYLECFSEESYRLAQTAFLAFKG